MVRNPKHQMLNPPNHDELALKQYILSLKHHLGRKTHPRKRDIYERRGTIQALQGLYGRLWPFSWGSEKA